MEHTHSHHDPEEESITSQSSEMAHRATVIATWDRYASASISANNRRMKDFLALSTRQQALLPDYLDLLAEIDRKIVQQAEVVQLMVHEDVFPMEKLDEGSLTAPAPQRGDHERLRSTLRQIARDWSSVGSHERSLTYDPILASLSSHFSSISSSERASSRILVPGAGLARLPWEIVRAGFSCQANDFNLHMIIASSFILNHTTRKEEFGLFPYLHSLSNVKRKEDILEEVKFPDILPSEVSEMEADFSFAAGDFLEIYDEDESWDGIVTCFFLDTARNIIDYLERIWALLKPGGCWINCGPTLWHFENSSDGASSIELTVEDLKSLARRIGFVIKDEKEIVTPYTASPKTMLRSEYVASFWAATKPL